MQLTYFLFSLDRCYKLLCILTNYWVLGVSESCLKFHFWAIFRPFLFQMFSSCIGQTVGILLINKDVSVFTSDTSLIPKLKASFWGLLG